MNYIKRRIFSYKEAVEKLNSLQSNAELLAKLQKAGPQLNHKSLPEMRQFLARIGYKPHDLDKLNLIHISGTKGKGSTSALTQSVIHNYDPSIKTGLFTSPHLVAVRERIRINGKPISESKFAMYSQQVWDQLEKNPPIYFRYLTLLALHTFIQEKVDCAILEVGVGGEYDSTNIIENPVVCGITALGLDHVAVLGNTIDQIAWHKAGIIKPNVPVVCFEQVPEAMQVVENRAKEKNAPLTVLHARDIKKLEGVKIGLAGTQQKYNALTAIELSKIWLKRVRGIDERQDVPEKFKKGLELVTWPGRAQELSIHETKYAKPDCNVTWYLDGAHTVESLEGCADWFKSKVKTDTTRVLVFNCTHGRDSDRLLRVISALGCFDHVVFTTNITTKKGYSVDNTSRADTLQELTSVQQSLANSWKNQVPGFNPKHIHIVDTIQEAVEFTVNLSSNNHVQVLSTGSLIMVGNTLSVLGIEPQ